MQRNTMLAAGISSVVLGAIAVIGVNVSANAQTSPVNLPSFATGPAATSTTDPTAAPLIGPNVTTLPWSTTSATSEDADDQGENENDSDDVNDSSEVSDSSVNSQHVEHVAHSDESSDN